MNARELASYHAGIRHAADAALIAAQAIEDQDHSVRQTYHVAIEVLRGLAEGLKAEAAPTDGTVAMVARIAQDPAAEGTETCPHCAGRVAWIKDASNGRIHARCEAAGCFTVL